MAGSPKTGDLDVGRRIAARREQLGLSRKALAEATGLSYPYIAQIETGYRMPSSRHQGPIARVLGLSLDEVFGVEVPDSAERLGGRTTQERLTMPEAIDNAAMAIEALPPAVRLEALSQLQLRIMTGVAADQARRQ